MTLLAHSTLISPRHRTLYTYLGLLPSCFLLISACIGFSEGKMPTFYGRAIFSMACMSASFAYALLSRIYGRKPLCFAAVFISVAGLIPLDVSFLLHVVVPFTQVRWSFMEIFGDTLIVLISIAGIFYVWQELKVWSSNQRLERP
jgi:hypothetical protein